MVAKVNDEWVVGKIRGSEGLFPMSFVDSVPSSLPPVEENKKEEKKVS